MNLSKQELFCLSDFQIVLFLIGWEISALADIHKKYFKNFILLFLKKITMWSHSINRCRPLSKLIFLPKFIQTFNFYQETYLSWNTQFLLLSMPTVVVGLHITTPFTSFDLLNKRIQQVYLNGNDIPSTTVGAGNGTVNKVDLVLNHLNLTD